MASECHNRRVASFNLWHVIGREVGPMSRRLVIGTGHRGPDRPEELGGAATSFYQRSSAADIDRRNAGVQTTGRTFF